MNVKSLVIILSLVAALVVAGCTSPTSSEKNKDIGVSSSAGYQTGSSSSSGSTSNSPSTQLEVTVNSIEKYQPDNQYTKPATGYEFLLVDFSVKNSGYKSGFSFNPYNVKVKDPDGYSYGYSSDSYIVPNAFSMQKIPYGETVRGKLLFEVVPKPSGTAYTIRVD